MSKTLSIIWFCAAVLGFKFLRAQILPPPVFEDPVAETLKGHVRGKVVTFWEIDPKDPYQNKRIYYNISTFLGIPYAQPPVVSTTGTLRFKYPEAAVPWQGTLETKVYGAACPQIPQGKLGQLIKKVHEDCLYLNVFSPNTSQTIDKKYPVIIHIHGGSFDHGSGEIYPGYKLATLGVVVVTFNYRLGALGFLTTNNEYAPGNYGMMDQVMAMKWVRENIRGFNGNPGIVTIMGESAGAASVGLHLLSEQSQDLFHRAICMSGSGLAPWAVYTNRDQAYNHTKELGRKTGCYTDEKNQKPQEIIDCLNIRTSIDISEAVVVPDYGMRPPWAPVVQGYYPYVFLQDDPRKLLQHGALVTKVPVMQGVVKDEAGAFLYDSDPDYSLTLPEFYSTIREFVKKENYSLEESVVTAIGDSMIFEYTFHPDAENLTVVRQEMINLLSDHQFNAPNELSAKYHAQHGLDVFEYTFDYRADFSRYPNWTGVPHGIELNYVFGMPFLLQVYPEWEDYGMTNYTLDDRNVSDFMMNMWINFANYGEPVPDAYSNFPYLFKNVSRWYKYTTDRRFYLQINYTCEHLEDYLPHRCAYWNDYIPVASKMDLVTVTPTYHGLNQQQANAYIAATYSLGAAAFIMILALFVVCFLSAKKTDDGTEFD